MFQAYFNTTEGKMEGQLFIGNFRNYLKMTLMKNIVSLFLVLPFFFLYAQERQVSEEIMESIKKQVWTPFMEAYAELDTKKLKSIHAADIFRVTIDQNDVRTGEAYLEEFGGFLEQVKNRKGKLGIAFAILTTAIDSSGDLAYQTGYYEFSSQGENDPDLVVRGYGHFNVGLRKTNGVWKLFLDSDKRIDITKAEFEEQEIVYRLKP